MSRSDGRSFALAVALVGTTTLAWFGVVRSYATMQMSEGAERFSLAGAAAFTWQWGVMMAAMMLPSAAPMILLYRGASQRAAEAGERVLPAELFALVYLALWLLTGIPVYAASIALGNFAARSATFAGAMPYAVAATLIAAGIYQLTPAKRACLAQCERPVDFLMRRWRTGYAATLRMAVAHGAYCIGCCWALMVVLVAAGAMSLPWVLAISLAVFAEKVLPAGGRTAWIIGVALMGAGIAVTAKPELAVLLMPRGMP